MTPGTLGSRWYTLEDAQLGLCTSDHPELCQEHAGPHLLREQGHSPPRGWVLSPEGPAQPCRDTLLLSPPGKGGH